MGIVCMRNHFLGRIYFIKILQILFGISELEIHFAQWVYVVWEKYVTRLFRDFWAGKILNFDFRNFCIINIWKIGNGENGTWEIDLWENVTRAIGLQDMGFWKIEL